jgi:hypothetical protein
MRWRSPREIAFRINQEARNVGLLRKPPRLSADFRPAVFLPDANDAVDRIRGTPTEAAIIARAGEILAHRFPLLGVAIDTGPQIRWRRDYSSGVETAPIYFRRIPYLDVTRAGDHKIIWELNRHQHLVLLAQAYRFTGRTDFLNEIGRHIDSWLEGNPFQRGINWSSALEVAFRALSWMWVDHLVGPLLDPALRRRFLEGLYRHGHHLAVNLSVYFSPNTHLLGEAVALHALGKMFREPGWQALGAQTVAEQMERQVQSDGSHFEQSTYYHVYALDMFLFHAALAPVGEPYRASLARMAEYLDALLGPSRSLPFLGDDDGGRFFHPYGSRSRFGRATLATCGLFANDEDLCEQAVWWLGPNTVPRKETSRNSRWFPDAGIAVMVSGDVHIVVDAGPFGPFRSGHSHADTLSLVVRRGEQDLLIDPGTFTYADPNWRDWFRGTAAHNTVRIDRLDQATPGGPFAWSDPPRVTVHHWRSDSEMDELDGECSYRGFRHRRRIRFLKAGLLLIVDDIDGPPGMHEVEQFWHLGADTPRSCLVLEDPVEICDGWSSPVFSQKIAATVLCVRRNATLPCRLAAGILLDSNAHLRIEPAGFVWERPSVAPVTITL